MNCKLIGIQSIIYQIIIFLIILFTLIIKLIYFENPRRKLKIFILDGFKQVVSMSLVHIVNIFFSIYYGNSTNSDNCYWYFSSLLLDCVFGILCNYILLKFITSFFHVRDQLRSGNYFTIYYKYDTQRVRINYLLYLYQLLIWCICIIITKLVIIVLQINLSYFWIKIGRDLFIFFKFNSNEELIFNLILFPIIVNIIQFLVQDNFLRKSKFKKKDIIILEEFYVLNDNYILKNNKKNN